MAAWTFISCEEFKLSVQDCDAGNTVPLEKDDGRTEVEV